jgi:hypothetical protein
MCLHSSIITHKNAVTTGTILLTRLSWNVTDGAKLHLICKNTEEVTSCDNYVLYHMNNFHLNVLRKRQKLVNWSSNGVFLSARVLQLPRFLYEFTEPCSRSPPCHLRLEQSLGNSLEYQSCFTRPITKVYN